MKIPVVNLGHVAFRKTIKVSTAAPSHSNHRAGIRVIDLGSMATGQSALRSGCRSAFVPNGSPNVAGIAQLASRVSSDGSGRCQRAGNAAGKG